MGKLLSKEVKRGEYDDLGYKFQRRDDVKVRHYKGRNTQKRRRRLGKLKKGETPRRWRPLAVPKARNSNSTDTSTLLLVIRSP